MKDLSRDEFLALREPALWPLALLTEGKVDRILIEEMFAELLEQKLYNMLPIGYTIAAWFLRNDDLSWLNKEYQKMFEIFKDSPALQWMEESVREEERQKAQQQLRSQLREKDKEVLAMFRQTVVGLVSQRFPTLLRLAKTQVRTLKEPEHLQQLMLHLSLARDADEAQDVLFSLNEEKDEEGTQESTE